MTNKSKWIFMGFSAWPRPSVRRGEHSSRLLMIRAYDKTYLEKGRISLARMLDFAVYDLNYDPTAFFDLFIKSDVAARFERGESSIIAGKSGVELAYLLLEEAGVPFERVKSGYCTGRSKEYWAGHSLAYYQWKTSLSFGKIAMYVPITAVLALYIRRFAGEHPHHPTILTHGSLLSLDFRLQI